MDKVTRRLSAILAADVVGYSRLIRADEEGTLTALKALRKDVIEPKIAEHHGRIVKLMGDGMLAEFPSVVDAVRNAVEVQEAVAENQAGLPEDRRIVFRVGVNLGDVVIDGDDIHGDGVNLAARLEALADPGGVCISGAVYDQVRDRIHLAFQDLGEREVKNIERPIRMWQWTLSAATAADAAAATDDVLPLPDKPSIAVLPFDNMSGDPEQEHFADGMAEDIITALSRMPWFFVIARNSSFTYKGRAVDVTKVAAELGVKYVLEGSVRKGGNRLRITAQLIDATSGKHIWAERYDRELLDIFEVQDEVTQAIVAAVAPEFLSTEARAARRKDARQLDAWECVMRGRAHLWKLGREDAAEARQLFERAIELAPGGEFGASDLALVYFLEFFYRWGDSPEQSLKKMLITAQKAVAVDESDPLSWTVLAWASQFARRWDEATESIERAIQLSPNFVPAIGIRGGIRALNGQPDSGIELINQAARLSPSDGFMPFWMLSIFWAYYAKGQYDEAAKAAQRGLRTAPDNPTLRRQLAAAYAMLGRMDEAKAALDEYLRIEPDHTIADSRKIPSSVPEDLERFLDGLRKAGLPE
jgi:adenylate cyclase